MKKWKKFESKTHKLLQELNPKAQVVQNVFIRGKLSLKKRQVDVKLVELGNYNFIAFECKDHRRPLDIPVIEAFNTKLQDVKAKKGAIVSNSPFTEGAKNMAEKLEIDLLGLVDTGDSEIRTKLFTSMIISDTFVKSMAVRIDFKASFFGGIPADNKQIQIYTNKSSAVNFVPKVFTNLWNDTEFLIKQPGTHEYTDTNCQVLTTFGEIAPCRATFIYEVVEKHYIGEIQIINAKGIYNFREHGFQTRSMETEVINAYEKEKIWKEISPREADNTKVSLRLTCSSLLPEN